jgi:signal transduction histidine kinase
VKPQFGRNQEIPVGTKSWCEGKILEGETIRLDSLEQFPPEARKERDMDAAEGTLSLLAVPIRGRKGHLAGCVGLHSHERPKAWTDDDAARLKLVGDAVATLLERKRLEDTLREVSHRLHRSQDEERRRIARELHDSTAQLLAAVMMNLGLLEDRFASRDAKAGKLVKESLALVERGSQEVRTLAYLLHPPLLDQMGLEPALRSYVEGFSKRSGIKVALEVALGEQRLPEEIELVLFRVVQEGLGNINRHSGSRTARISISRTEPGIVLEVADQGVGIPPKTLRAIQRGLAAQGVGLAAMLERLHEIGGELTVDSSPSGTVLRAVVPVATFQI